MSAWEQASSPGASQACAMQRDGKHRWQETEDRTSLFCSRCGLFAPPCHSETGRHQWHQYKGRGRRGPRFCARCGLTRPPPPRGRGPIWKERLATCFDRDGPGCFYCGRDLAEKDAVLDHFIPSCCGGSDSAVNRRASCSLCDERKADQLPWEFMPERFSPSDVPRHAWRERSTPTDVRMIESSVLGPAAKS